MHGYSTHLAMIVRPGLEQLEYSSIVQHDFILELDNDLAELPRASQLEYDLAEWTPLSESIFN
jgi:hypothetical protein